MSDSKQDNSRLIKYMGASDVRIVERGETVMDTLPPLPHPLRFKRSNGWTLDASKFPEVTEEWWDVLVGTGEFRDVTDDKVKPLNAHQTTFLGMGNNTAYNPALDALSTDAPVTVDVESTEPPATDGDDAKGALKGNLKGNLKGS